MKLARFRTPDGKVRHGIIDGPTMRGLHGDLFGRRAATGEQWPLAQVRLLAPLEPAAILCFGRNYKAHAEEGGSDIPQEPLLFIKAGSALNDPGAPIVIPKVAPAQVDYEAELAVVIGQAARHVTPERALDHVLGYTCANDVSARDCQVRDGQWARAKSFDTFCPLGPWIETELDPANVRVQGRLNGNVMQDASTALMIFSVRHLVSYLSRGMTLPPGTVLLTGTPAGCGFAQKPPVWLKPGDVFEVEIEGLGVLRNPVSEET